MQKMLFQPVEFTVENFYRYMYNLDNWHSLPFYTAPGGYKMYVSMLCQLSGLAELPNYEEPRLICKEPFVQVSLMSGEYDDNLKWPFETNFTFKIVNQREDLFYNVYIPYIGMVPTGSPPKPFWTKEVAQFENQSYLYSVKSVSISGTRSFSSYFHNCNFRNNSYTDCLMFRIE